MLVSGTAGGQAIVILSAPLLTRLYSPEDFGALGVYMAVLAVITLIASLRYELAIPLPRSEGSARALLTLSLGIVICVSAITALSVTALGHRLAEWTNAPVLEPYLWALPLGVLVGGAQKVLIYWALRRKSFGQIARVRFQQGGAVAAFQVGFGALHWGTLGLIAGHLLGYASGLTSLVRYALRTAKAALLNVRIRRLWHAACRYRNFPLYSTWSDMANVAGTQLPLILLASLFSPLVAGLYMLAHRVANAPAALVAESVGKAFMTSAATARLDENLPDLSLRVFGLLLRLGVGPLVIIAIVAPEFFAIVFGAAWSEAGQYLQFMAPWLAAVFIFAPLSTLYAVLEQQSMDLCFQVTLLVTRMSAFVAGATFAGPLMAIGLYSVSAAVVYIGFGARLLHAAGVGYRELARTSLSEMLLVAPLGIALFLAKQLLAVQTPSLSDPSSLVLLSLAAALGVISVSRAGSAMKGLAQLG